MTGMFQSTDAFELLLDSWNYRNSELLMDTGS